MHCHLDIYQKMPRDKKTWKKVIFMMKRLKADSLLSIFSLLFPPIIKGTSPAIFFTIHKIKQESKKVKEMHTSKKVHLLHHLFMFNLLFITSIAQRTPTSIFCGKIQIQAPFLSSNSSVVSPLNRMILCKSEKLYFRTSLGLFQVSSINYTSKTLTISHPTCSPSRLYVSPSLLSAGFPSPPQPNSLLLFNCLNKKQYPMSPFIRNCSRLHACGVTSKIQQQEVKSPYSCLLVEDLEKLDEGFHPKDLNCSSYSRVYKTSSDDDDYEGVGLGTRISFDIPDHVPNMCNECEKPNGNCGIGLRCICHAEECKDKVISMVGCLNPIDI